MHNNEEELKGVRYYKSKNTKYNLSNKNNILFPIETFFSFRTTRTRFAILALPINISHSVKQLEFISNQYLLAL